MLHRQMSHNAKGKGKRSNFSPSHLGFVFFSSFCSFMVWGWVLFCFILIILTHFYSLVFLNIEPPRFSCSSSWALKKNLSSKNEPVPGQIILATLEVVSRNFSLQPLKAEWVILPLGRCGHRQSHNISIQHIHEWSHLSTTPGYRCFSTFPALFSVWIGTAVITSVSQEFKPSEVLYVYTERVTHTASMGKQSQGFSVSRHLNVYVAELKETIW